MELQIKLISDGLQLDGCRWLSAKKIHSDNKKKIKKTVWWEKNDDEKQEVDDIIDVAHWGAEVKAGLQGGAVAWRLREICLILKNKTSV